MTNRTFFVLMCFMSIIAFTSTAHAQSSKKTITLPNGEVILDLTGEWDVHVENYGRWSSAGNYPQLVKVTQTGSSFVSIRMMSDPYNPKGAESIRGELDKHGFKKVQIVSPQGPVEANGKIDDDGNRMVIDSPDRTIQTFTRR